MHGRLPAWTFAAAQAEPLGPLTKASCDRVLSCHLGRLMHDHAADMCRGRATCNATCRVAEKLMSWRA